MEIIILIFQVTVKHTWMIDHFLQACFLGVYRYGRLVREKEGKRSQNDIFIPSVTFIGTDHIFYGKDKQLKETKYWVF